jgi:hypothetical protein
MHTRPTTLRKRSALETIALLFLVSACGSEDGGTSTTTVAATAPGSAGSDSTGSAETGAGALPEHELCARADECNVLEPGTSVQDCTDLEVMCTDELISSAYTDWNAEVEACLELANCQNFLNCATELSACPPLEPAAECAPACLPEAGGYCWYGTDYEGACPTDYNGDGSCDCGCQFTDVDCP